MSIALITKPCKFEVFMPGKLTIHSKATLGKRVTQPTGPQLKRQITSVFEELRDLSFNYARTTLPPEKTFFISLPKSHENDRVKIGYVEVLNVIPGDDRISEDKIQEIIEHRDRMIERGQAVNLKQIVFDKTKPQLAAKLQCKLHFKSGKEVYIELFLSLDEKEFKTRERVEEEYKQVVVNCLFSPDSSFNTLTPGQLEKLREIDEKLRFRLKETS